MRPVVLTVTDAKGRQWTVIGLVGHAVYKDGRHTHVSDITQLAKPVVIDDIKVVTD